MRPWVLDFLREQGLAGITWLVPTAGVVYGVTMLTIVIVFLVRSAQINFSVSGAMSACIAGVVGVIAGGHLYYLLATGTFTKTGPVDWITQEGAGSWGGYLGCMLGMAAYCKWKKTDPWPYLDVLGSVGPLAAAIGRWGCLMFGCDFGRVTSVALAVNYPAGSLAYRAHVASGVLPPDAAQSLSVHPLPIYLSLNGVLLFLLLTAIWRRSRHIPGVTIMAFWALYGFSRFFWEFLRAPAAGGASVGLSLPQWMAVAAICVGGATGVIASRRWKQATVRPCAADA